MKQKIINELKELEAKKDIKILFAVEAGSRLWRMASEDSDYDVRFVFVQKRKNYLSLDAKKNMEKVIDHTEGEIDLVGFDIFKFCSLLMKSNPSIIEWLQSDLLYYGEKPKELMDVAFNEFNPVALYYHYASMCKQNYEKYLKSGMLVTYKKYLYAMRGLIVSKLVEKTLMLPPIRFTDCLKRCEGIIPENIVLELEETINKKKNGNEKAIIKNIVSYDMFIEDFLRERISKEVKGKSPSKTKIDKYILTKLGVPEEQ